MLSPEHFFIPPTFGDRTSMTIYHAGAGVFIISHMVMISF